MKLSLGLLVGGLSLAAAMPAASQQTKKGLWFDRFVVLVLENTDKATALGNDYYAGLAQQGMLLNGYQATTHPSQPNYITMIASTIAAGVFDDADHNTTQNSLVDILEPAGISWKAYMEGYHPLANGECNPVHVDGHYARKHNPFMSFDNIRNNTARCQNIVNAEDTFAKDVAMGKKAPQYMYYVPNLLNDAHDTSVAYSAADTKRIIDIMLGNKEFMKNTLILVTFDENDIYAPQKYGTQNDVYSVLLGNDTLACYDCIDRSFYNHFSQLVTIEKNWNLPNIPQPDGHGAGWDSWMLPFGMLRTERDPKACANAPCYQ